MYKIAVIGSADTVIGFKALGLETFPAASSEAAGEILRRLTYKNDKYAIIYIEEIFAEQLSEEISRFKALPTPAVIPIPGKEGSLGIGQAALHDAVMRAIGTDI